MPSQAFDLRRFAPPDDVTFHLRKHDDFEFRVDADPDVDDIGQMLRIEGAIRGTSDETEEEATAALVEGKALLLRLIQERQPDVTELRIGPQELTVVFALIAHGPTVAQAVLAAITGANELGQEHDGPDDDPERERGDQLGEEQTDGPLASARRSSEQSSGSVALAAGPPATGTD